MLQIQHIKKEYHTGSLVQKALDDVSLTLRDNEFVAILGPSGSGKTTLLNIIGGLDQYDSGDLIINGISTKKYKDRDWDAYRNHTIGFVFQSYNLIPHQSLLSNVELALTISGISKSERTKRASQALAKVGLADQAHKKPNQLSGGQMQRVAIARALVNDPEILLADEPTGALDSETSVQVMNLLREVAKDRLVVMVTHNPELAEEYANRIVRVKDGKIVSDSNPVILAAGAVPPPVHAKMGKASMSFLTALGLSFNNLLTKKARTLLTAFAGSIGIIGIALIMALSNGVNDYIAAVEEETLSEYPIQITSSGIDLTSMITAMSGAAATSVYSDPDTEDVITIVQMMTTMFSQIDSNDLSALRAYIESGLSGLEPYVQAIEYIYNITPQIYLKTEDSYRQVNPDQTYSNMGYSTVMSSYMSSDQFSCLPDSENLYKEQYDVVAGKWPENYDECVLVLTSSGGISDLLMYTLGLRDASEYDLMIEQFLNSQEITVPDDIGTYSYEEVMAVTFVLVHNYEFYVYDEEYDVWTDKSDNEEYVMQLVENGETLKIVGIVKPNPDASASFLSTGIYYTTALRDYIVERASGSEIVLAQMANPEINVLTGEPFGEESSIDMESMFSFDFSGLEDLFSFDTDAISISDIDTSSLDFSDLDLASTVDFSDLDLSDIDLSDLDLSDLDLSGLDFGSISFSTSGFDTSSLDFSSLDLSDLDLSSMIDISSLDLSDVDVELDISAILAGVLSAVSDSLSESVEEALSALLEGYTASIEDSLSAYTDYSDAVTAYLASDEAQAIIADYLSSLENGDVSGNDTSDSDSSDLISALTAGLSEALADTQTPDVSELLGSFSEYLSSEEAQAILADAFSLDSVSEAVEEAISAYMAELMEAYMEAIMEQLSEQIAAAMASVMEEIMSQVMSQMMSAIAAEISSAMGSAMSQISAAIEEAITEAITQMMEEVMSQVMEEISSAIAESMSEAMSSISDTLTESITEAMEEMMESLSQELSASLADALSIDEDALADAFTFDMDTDSFVEMLTSMSSFSSSSYENNLATLGYADFDSPYEIDIYPIDFESKEYVIEILDQYNTRMEETGQEEKKITYTDLVGTLMTSVTDIINLISYVLIAFVAISLIVSSIMIGVITYISVLERRKEIGILRAIGASKNNISQVFNAETFIIGFLAGIIGIGLSLLILIPANLIIHMIAGNNQMNAVLHPIPCICLVVLSTVLTMLGGLLPSRAAAKSDPVTALRTD